MKNSKIAIGSLVFYAAIFLGFLGQGCRSTRPADKSTMLAASDPTDNQAETYEWSFDENETKAIFTKLFAASGGSGAPSPDASLILTGRVECRRSETLKNCSLRGRAPDKNLSAPMPIEQKLADRFLYFLLKSRPDLIDEQKLVCDLTCTTLSKNSPPFESDTLSCRFSASRLPNEVVFDANNSEKLSFALLQDQSFSPKISQLKGSLSCLWKELSDRPTCTVRAMVKDGFLDKASELSPDAAYAASREITAAILDYYSLDPPKDNKRRSLPKIVECPLNCLVDSQNFDKSGTRKFSCRASLPF